MAIRRRGLVLRGWVANLLPPRMALVDANVQTLTSRLAMPPVAIVDVGGLPTFSRDALGMLGW
jgi:dethiobiotin synthetase